MPLLKLEKKEQQTRKAYDKIARKDNAIISFLKDIALTIADKKFIGLEKKFDFTADSAITSLTSAALYAGKKIVIFTTKSGKVYALDENFKIEWVYSLKEKLTETELFFTEKSEVKDIYTTPTIADINKDNKNEIIFGTDTGNIYALNSMGKLLWTYKTKGKVRSNALVADINNDNKSEIIFGSNDKNLYALNSKGNLIWKFMAKSGIEAKPSFLKHKNKAQIIFGSNDGTIYSLDSNGKLFWQFKAKGKITAAASIGKIYGDSKDYIVVGSFDGYIYTLNSIGKLKWKHKTEGNIFSKASLADVNNDNKLEIIFGSCDNNIHALSCYGEEIWSYETDFWVAATPLVVDIDNDGRYEVIAGSYDKHLYILDAEGEFLLRYLPGVSSVTQQSGYYDETIRSQPGSYHGKKLCDYKSEGMIIGVACIENKEKNIVIGTENGKLNSFILSR
jgi:hypothetical protein